MSLLTSQAPNRQYANRPADERYPSLQAMIDAAQAEKNNSAERTYNLKDLHVKPVHAGESSDLHLCSPKGEAAMTHWAFGQLCATLRAPVSYLRRIPAPLAADCLNHGLADSDPGTTANLLVRATNGQPAAIRACTSEQYGRVWDANLYGSVARTLADRDGWSLPPTWSGEPAGAYRGDRDSFLILTNGGSIVNDPTAGTDGRMFRGIMIRNSEVGAASIVIETILLRYICGNHMLWGAVADQTFKRRHVGSRVERDAVREIARIAWNWTQQSASRDEAIIKALIDHDIATTKDAVIDELRAMGATREQAEDGYKTCEREESRVSPRSYWGIAQGLTRLSQQETHQDERYELDKLAAVILKRGAKVYA